MIVISRSGDLGPADALELRHELDDATRRNDPNVMLDLRAVDSLHPAVVAAIVRAARRARQAAGGLELRRPTSPDASRMLGLVAIDQLI
ncbi:MAG: STAS domain-containing protein [Actinomycetota bacterium]